MNGKQKLYFLLNSIDDVREISPSGQPLKIDPMNDLNNNFREVELTQLFTKLEKDERVLKVLKVPSRTKDIDIIENLDPYDHADDGCWHIKLLPTFDGYYLKIQHQPEYQEFSNRKPPVKQTQPNASRIESLYEKIAEVDEQIRIRREAWAKAQSTINNNPFYAEVTRAGHLAKLEQQAQTDIGNFIKQKETYLMELSLRRDDIQSLSSLQPRLSIREEEISITQAKNPNKVSYDNGLLNIEGKKVKFDKESFRAKLLELLLKDDKNRKKEWSWDEAIETIESTKGEEATTENKKKFYPACDGLTKHIASKIGVNDLLIFNKSTVQINPKYL